MAARVHLSCPNRFFGFFAVGRAEQYCAQIRHQARLAGPAFTVGYVTFLLACLLFQMRARAVSGLLLHRSRHAQQLLAGKPFGCRVLEAGSSTLTLATATAAAARLRHFPCVSNRSFSSNTTSSAGGADDRGAGVEGGGVKKVPSLADYATKFASFVKNRDTTNLSEEIAKARADLFGQQTREDAALSQSEGEGEGRTDSKLPSQQQDDPRQVGLLENFVRDGYVRFEQLVQPVSLAFFRIVYDRFLSNEIACRAHTFGTMFRFFFFFFFFPPRSNLIILHPLSIHIIYVYHSSVHSA